MEKIKTEINGLYVIQNKSHKDNRGLFQEMWNQIKMKDQKLIADFSQDNISTSKQNVLRGLHFQNYPHDQLKFIQVIKGKILDVAVDIRRKSSTFGKYFSIELSSINQKGLWIPKGFAHGFAALEENTIVLYKCSGAYNPSEEYTIKWNDENLNINWGISNPIISKKDQMGMSLRDYIINKKLNN